MSRYPQDFLLLAFARGLKSLFETKGTYQPSKELGNYERYRQTAYYLHRRGWLKISKQPDGKRFLVLTKVGSMEMLMAQAWLSPTSNWDGKWRMIIFDIPEAATDKRNQLRRLLLTNGFAKLQASVYIHPYPLNRSAVSYLKTTGLINFIRLGRLEELDDDSEFVKKFNLKKPSKA